MQDLRFSEQCFIAFNSSGMYSCVAGLVVCDVRKACNSTIFLMKMAKLKAFQTPLTINTDTTTYPRRSESSHIIQFIKLRNSFAICQEILSIRMRPIELQWMGKVHSNLFSKAQSLHGALTAAVLDTIFFIVQL